jgi:hypothetical protein
MMRKIGLLLVIALLLALVPAVLAGGWAVVTLDEPPGEIHAGRPWTVSFRVLQHGETPVHRLDANSPVEPLLVAENPATGQRLEIEALPTKVTGQFVAEVTFPSDGAWTWTILPNPLAGETLFEPLTVLPAAAPQTEAQPVAPAAALEAAPATQPDGVAPQPSPSTGIVAENNNGAVAAGLRWLALAAVVTAGALFVVQSRRRAAPRPQVES